MARTKAKAPAVQLDGKTTDALTKAGWVQVSGGAGGEAWTDGLVVQGELVSVTDSTFTNDDGALARNVTILTDAGERTMRCPVGLEARLMRLSKGDPVRIECLGKVRTKAGRKAWAFDLHAKPQAGLKPAIPFEQAAKRGRPPGSRNKRAAAK